MESKIDWVSVTPKSLKIDVSDSTSKVHKRTSHRPPAPPHPPYGINCPGENNVPNLSSTWV